MKHALATSAMEGKACVCDECGARAAYRWLRKAASGSLDRRLPIAWAGEFCAREPDNPAKNRLLCPACNEALPTLRGTIRFIGSPR